MKNYVNTGDIVEVTAPAGGVTSGAGVIAGALFGVALVSAEAGQPVNICTKGLYELPKLNTANIAAGGRVSWDAVNGRCVAPGTGFFPIGVATVAAGNGTTTVRVRLDGISTGCGERPVRGTGHRLLPHRGCDRRGRQRHDHGSRAPRRDQHRMR